MYIIFPWITWTKLSFTMVHTSDILVLCERSIPCEAVTATAGWPLRATRRKKNQLSHLQASRSCEAFRARRATTETKHSICHGTAVVPSWVKVCCFPSCQLTSFPFSLGPSVLVWKHEVAQFVLWTIQVEFITHIDPDRARVHTRLHLWLCAFIALARIQYQGRERDKNMWWGWAHGAAHSWLTDFVLLCPEAFVSSMRGRCVLKLVSQ